MHPITLKQGLTVAVLSALVSGTTAFAGVTLADLRSEDGSDRKIPEYNSDEQSAEQAEAERRIKLMQLQEEQKREEAIREPRLEGVDINQDGVIDARDNEIMRDLRDFRDIDGSTPSDFDSERMREIQEEIERRILESTPRPDIDQDQLIDDGDLLEQLRKQNEMDQDIHPAAMDDLIREQLEWQQQEQGKFYRERIEREYFAPDREETDNFFPAAPSLVRVIGEAIARIEEVLNKVLGNPEAESALQSVIGRLHERLQGGNGEPDREDIEAIQAELRTAMEIAKRSMEMEMKAAAPEEGMGPRELNVPDVISQMGFILEEIMPRVFELFDESSVSIPARAIQSYEEALTRFRSEAAASCEGNSADCPKVLRSVFTRMEEMRSSMEAAMESSVNADSLRSAIDALMGAPVIEEEPTMEFNTFEDEYPSFDEDVESEMLIPEAIQY